MIDPTTALRVLLQSHEPLVSQTEPDTKRGIYRAPPGLPADWTAVRKAVVLQALPAVIGSSGRVAVRHYTRCYAKSGPDSLALARSLYSLFYGPDGQPLGPRRVNDRWFLRSGSLSILTTELEDDSNWPVTLVDITTRWDALEGAYS